MGYFQSALRAYASDIEVMSPKGDICVSADRQGREQAQQLKFTRLVHRSRVTWVHGSQ